MNFEQARDGIQRGYEARRSSWADPNSFIRLVADRLMQFQPDLGWKHWAASIQDEEATDWLVAHPSRTSDA